MPITKIIEENSVKDIEAAEDMRIITLMGDIIETQ
jgi:hypothetical protein